MDVVSQQGSPIPLGASAFPEGVNFAIAANTQRKLKLNIFEFSNSTLNPIAEIQFDPNTNRTGKVWHTYVEGLKPNMLYSYQNQKGNHLLDPYAKEVFVAKKWGGTEPYIPCGVIISRMNFDWENDASPKIPLKDLIIYEMHVRGFTIDESAHTAHPGSYLGLIEKIPYLKELGVNAIELLPVHEFNELDTTFVGKEKGLLNFWGYQPLNFFSPMSRYASEYQPGTPTREFKTMVKELHRNGIEVILDVVFNHTGEGDGNGPIYSYRGLYSKAYYMFDEENNYLNFSGCGNTFNANHPVSIELIIHTLRYWVSEMHIDGFRFDLASALTRGKKGDPLEHPPLIDAINSDPILSTVKLIAEPWDCGGLYHVGRFPSNNGVWAEWNGQYRDAIRNFIKGTGYKGEFTERICGSQDLYGYNRKPFDSINFITSHDGFTLHDLVSYNTKYNEANGENNHDGTDEHISWNCGVEGETKNAKIIELRLRQKRNFFLALFISQGVPLFPMGDEYGHTKLGNNNTWCQDSLNWFQWDQLHANHPFYEYVRFLIQFRHQHPLLRRGEFFSDADIVWHGFTPNNPSWGDGVPFIAFSLVDHDRHEDLYIVFNADHLKHQLIIPKPPEGKQWHWIIHTGIDSGFYPEPKPLQYEKTILLPYSSILLKAF